MLRDSLEKEMENLGPRWRNVETGNDAEREERRRQRWSLMENSRRLTRITGTVQRDARL